MTLEPVLRPEGARIVRRLGAGAMGTVDLVAFGQSRWVRKRALESPRAAEALAREAALLIRHAHPQLPSCVAFEPMAGDVGPSLWMNAIDGLTADVVLSSLSIDASVRALVLAGNALDHLHRRGIVHGDVKPENLLITTADDGPGVFLLDLGIAGDAPVGGSPLFFSPERRAGAPGSRESDWFALGRSFAESVDANSPLAPLLDRMCHRDPRERLVGCDELTDALRGLGWTQPWRERPCATQPSWIGDESLLVSIENACALGSEPAGARAIVLTGPGGSGKSRWLREIAARRLATGDASVSFESTTTWGTRNQPRFPEYMGSRGEAARSSLACVEDLDDITVAQWLRERSSSPWGAPALVTTSRSKEGPGERVAVPPWRRRDVDELVRVWLADRPSCDHSATSLKSPRDLAMMAGESPGTALERLTRWTKDPQRAERDLRSRIQDAVATATPETRRALTALALAHPDSLPRDAFERLAIALSLTPDWGAALLDLWGVDERGDHHVRGSLIADAVLETVALDERRDGARALAAIEPLLSSAVRVTVLRYAGLESEALADGIAAFEAAVRRGDVSTVTDLERSLQPLADPETSIDLTLGRAMTLATCGRLLEAQQLVSSLEPRIGPAAREVRRHLIHASIAEAQGDLMRAREHLDAVDDLSLTAQMDRDLRVRVGERLGAAHYRRGDIDIARGLWESTLSAAEPASPVAADLENDLGVLAAREHRPEEARARHERALALRCQLQDLDGQIRSWTNLGNLDLGLDRLDAAESAYEQALVTARATRATGLEAVLIGNVALVDERRGAVQRALARVREGAAVRRRLGDERGALLMSQRIAHLSLATDDLDAAAAALAEAAHRLPRHGNRPERAAQARLDLRWCWAVGDPIGADAAIERLRSASGPEDTVAHGILEASQDWRSGRSGAALERLITMAEQADRCHARAEREQALVLAARIALEAGSVTRAVEAVTRIDANPTISAFATVDRALVRGACLRLSGLFSESHRELESVRDRIESMGVPDLRARWYLERGEWALAVGQFRRASAHLERVGEQLLAVAERVENPAWRRGYLAAFDRVRLLEDLERCLGAIESAAGQRSRRRT